MKGRKRGKGEGRMEGREESNHFTQQLKCGLQSALTTHEPLRVLENHRDPPYRTASELASCLWFSRSPWEQPESCHFSQMTSSEFMCQSPSVLVLRGGEVKVR